MQKKVGDKALLCLLALVAFVLAFGLLTDAPAQTKVVPERPQIPPGGTNKVEKVESVASISTAYVVDATALAQALVGPEVDIMNATLTGSAVSSGTFSDGAPSGGTADGITLAVSYPEAPTAARYITFALPQPAHVVLGIYDAAGRQVKTIVNGSMPDGAHPVRWDGTNDAGSRVAKGVYFCKLTALGLDKTAKLVVVK
jgi:flagellar hook assembly protein FlgD